MMKRSFKYLIVVASLFTVCLGFVACSDDDDDDEKSIVGVWSFRDVSIRDLQTSNTAYDGKMKQSMLDKGRETYTGTKLVLNYDGTAVINDSLVLPKYKYGYETLILFYSSGVSDTLKVSLNKNDLTLIEDYTSDYKDMGADEFAKIGISDTTNFKVTKAIAGINYGRIK